MVAVTAGTLVLPNNIAGQISAAVFGNRLSTERRGSHNRVGTSHHDAIRLGELTKELDPFSPYYGSYLAEQYSDASMFDKAVEEAESVLDLRHNCPVVNLVLGETYADLGQFDNAIGYHERPKDNYFWSFALAGDTGVCRSRR